MRYPKCFIVPFAVLMVLLFLGGSLFAAGNGEKLLLSFEPDESSKIQSKGYRGRAVFYPAPTKKGDSTQGQHAMSWELTKRTWGQGWLGYQPKSGGAKWWYTSVGKAFINSHKWGKKQ